LRATNKAAMQIIMSAFTLNLSGRWFVIGFRNAR